MSRGRGNWVLRNERGRERAVRGREWAPGPVRRALTTKRAGFSGPPRQPLRPIGPFSQPKSKPFIGKRGFKTSQVPLKDGMANLSGVEMGTKLYISNLDCQIKYRDIDELFSKVGKLKRWKVHYDRTGQPSGSAEVVYEKRSDAIKAWRHYNGILLVGRIMKVDIVDTNLDHFMSHSIRIVGDMIQVPQRTVVRPRSNCGGVQPEWMRRNGHNHFQCSREEIVDMLEDESGTEFENLRVEATYF